MPKNVQIAVRSHVQEREWLLSLGNGDICQGVWQLIQQTRQKQGKEEWPVTPPRSVRPAKTGNQTGTIGNHKTS